MRVYLIGFMGSGKSHWGNLLSKELGIPFFDLDNEIEKVEGKSITEIFENHGEEYFRSKEKEQLNRISETNNDAIISCGGGTPCFFGNIDFMKEHGKVIWLNTSIDALLKRLSVEKLKRPLIAKVSDDEMRAFVMKKLHDRKIYYEQANIMVDEDNVSLNQLITLLNNE